MNIKRDFSQLNCELGIDKLHIYTDQFQLNSIQNWVHKPNGKAEGQTEIEHRGLVNVAGELLYGEKLFCNDSHYSADFAHGMLRVKFNPSKFFHPYNLVSDADRIAHVLQYIQTDLQEKRACECNLFAANVGRMDLAAQAAMTKPVPEYAPVIQGAHEIKRANKNAYPHGWLIYNTQRELCIYDKGLEYLQSIGHKQPSPTNLQRVEVRYLNNKVLRLRTMFTNVQDVLNQPLKAQHAAYSLTRAALLPIEQSQIQLNNVDLSALTELLRVAINEKGRQALEFTMLALCHTGQFRVSAKELRYAAGQLYAEGLISINTARNLERKYEKLMLDVAKVSAAMQHTSELNYYANHQEFTAKFIEPYRTAI